MKQSVIIILCMLALTLNGVDVFAQCSMCKAVVETNAQASGNTSGINNGIVYLMGIPYLLIITVGYFIYKNHKKHGSVE